MQRYIAQEMIRAWVFLSNIQMFPDEETFGGVFMIYGLITSILIFSIFFPPTILLGTFCSKNSEQLLV